MTKDETIIPVHQWTDGGTEVLILRCCDKDGKSYGGFQWPLEVGAAVEVPDWEPTAECGNGLHGWPWGLSMGDGKDPDWAGRWIVWGADPATVVLLGGKVKAPRGMIRFVGDWQAATAFVLAGQIRWVHQASRGAASSTGSSGAASSTGYSGAAVVTGLDGTATGGRYGCIALAWWNKRQDRAEMRCALVGRGDGKDGKLKAGVAYRLNGRGQFVEVAE